MLEVILHQRTAVVGSGPPTMGVVGGAPPPPGGAPHGREGRPLNTPEETKTATGEVEGRMVKGSGSHRLVQVSGGGSEGKVEGGVMMSGEKNGEGSWRVRRLHEGGGVDGERR